MKETKALKLITSLIIVVGVTLTFARCNKADQNSPKGKYVVVLSVDGYRPDYTERADAQALKAMAAEGVYADFRPCYPSNTFPNHYSMVTGLHPQHHGLVNNRFYAPDVDDYYSLGDNERVHNPAFYFGEPTWNTAEKNGIKAGAYFWVGSETAVQGMRPTYWKAYDGRVPFTERADSVLAWLQKPETERPRLIHWYLQEPDGAGHRYGPNSDSLLLTVQEVDHTIAYFREHLAQLPIADEVNFIVVSDHGMTQLDPEKYTNLRDVLPKDSFYYVVEGAPTMLYTHNKEYIDEAMTQLAKLPHITAYRRADVPERFHFSQGDRIGDIVIIPDLGVQVLFRNEDRISTGGAHGFDNEHPDMSGIFYAVGPDFPQGKHAGKVPNITLYPLICRLLDIKPAPHDASEADVDLLLQP